MEKTKLPMTFKGTFVDGEFKPYMLPKFKALLAELERKQVTVTIDIVDEDVSREQHAYYRASIKWITQEYEIFGGWSTERLHSLLAGLFLSHKEYFSIGDKLIEIVVTESTANIGMKRMAKFIQEAWSYLAAEHGVYVPEASQFIQNKWRKFDEK